MGTLYYGDNLKWLRHTDRFPDASVDLVYLDPPFKSDANYNAFFKGKTGAAASQIKAFEDTWQWVDKDNASLSELQAVIADARTPGAVKKLLQAYHDFMGGCDMMAYLMMMAPRLVELHRVLKPTGSLYLHCDPTASHYLKLVLDATFEPENFRNEIVWRRTGAHGKTKRYGPIHDTILYYTKSGTFAWNYPKRPYMKGHVKEYFVKDEKGWRTNYYGNVLTGSGTRKGESGKPWRGFDPTAKGRHWAVPGKLLELIDEDISDLGQHQKLDYLFEKGFISIEAGEAWPIYGHYISTKDGQAVSDIWAYQPYTQGTVFGRDDECVDEDVRWLNPRDKERLHYPTQKPVALLKRIIEASSHPGDVVLDPFCGCGTTIDAAEELGRQWIGIDITQVAISTIKDRLVGRYKDSKAIKFLRESDPAPPGRAGSPLPAAGGASVPASRLVRSLAPPEDGAHGVTRPTEMIIRILGEPATPEDAAALAKEDEYGFQWWAAYNLVGGQGPKKKGGDGGIDGRIIFFDDPNSAAGEEIILQIKGGKLKADDVRALGFVVEREKAAMGVLISIDEPSPKMYADAAAAGFYTPKYSEKKFPKLQLRTVKELMEGKAIERPSENVARDETFKKAPKAKAKGGEQKELI